MNLRFASKHASALALCLLLAAGSAGAQQPPLAPAPAPQATPDAAKGVFLLTIFLKHDESRARRAKRKRSVKRAAYDPLSRPA